MYKYQNDMNAYINCCCSILTAYNRVLFNYQFITLYAALSSIVALMVKLDEMCIFAEKVQIKGEHSCKLTVWNLADSVRLIDWSVTQTNSGLL